MNRYIVILLLLVTIVHSHSLQVKYIKVTQTNSVTKLKKIYKYLDSLGLKSTYKTKNRFYYIYATSKDSSNDLEVPLRRIKKYFPQAYIVKTKGREHTHAEEKVVQKSDVKKAPENLHALYTSLAIGYSIAPTTHSIPEGDVEVMSPNNKGISYAFSAGYRYDDMFDFGLGYFQLDSTDLVFKNYYGECKFNFLNKSNFTPHMGMLAGFSSLHWQSVPISKQSADSNNDSGSILFGIELGGAYKLVDTMSLFINYQYIMMEQITNINIDNISKAELQHNTLHTFQFGLELHFYVQ